MWLLLCALLAVSAENEPKVAMSLDNAVVHQPARAADRELFAELAETVVVVADLPQDSPRNFPLLAKKFTEATHKPAVPREGSRTAILSTGPMLDGPDKVLLKSLTKNKDLIELKILHTAVRLQGTPLRRNIRWRPMAEVPVKLPAGRFKIKVIWQAVDSLPDGKTLEVPPSVHSAEVEVRLGK